MSRLFESFDFQNRSWDVRVLESLSLRSVFVCAVASLFLLGFVVAVVTYEIVRLHRFEWSNFIILPIVGLTTFRCARLVYRRLER
jgi:hypothetical protein